MLLSIITVVKHPAEGYDETHASVLREFGDSAEVEYIIKEWDAEVPWHEATPAVPEDGHLRIRQIKGQDQGVFDAMNQCVEAASGEWIIFLNAGDWLANGFAERLFEAIRGQPTNDFVYFDGVTVDAGDRREFLRRAPDTLDLSNFYHHVPVLHPCLVLRRSIMARLRFDLKYDLAADFDLMVRLAADSASGARIPAPGAFVISGGLSEQRRIRARTQATSSLLCHRRSWLEGAQILAAFVKFLIIHFLIVGVIRRLPALQRRARTHTRGQPPGTYDR